MTGVHLNVAMDSNTDSVLQTRRLFQDVRSYYYFPEVRKQDKFQTSQAEENVFSNCSSSRYRQTKSQISFIFKT